MKRELIEKLAKAIYLIEKDNILSGYTKNDNEVKKLIKKRIESVVKYDI